MTSMITTKFSQWGERLKKLWTTDNIIDLSVDIFLILWDVLSSPILIVVRLLRWTFNLFFVNRIKSTIKWFVHKVLKVK